jgi:hypothetical protein
MTVPSFAAAPHPQAVLRVLKNARRAYQTSGSAAGADIPTIANQPAANPLTVTGTVYVAPGCHMPSTVTVQIMQGGTAKGATTANVNLTTGAFSVAIPGNSATAGAGVTVQVVGPAHIAFTTTSNSFTLT